MTSWICVMLLFALFFLISHVSDVWLHFFWWKMKRVFSFSILKVRWLRIVETFFSPAKLHFFGLVGDKICSVLENYVLSFSNLPVDKKSSFSKVVLLRVAETLRFPFPLKLRPLSSLDDDMCKWFWIADCLFRLSVALLILASLFCDCLLWRRHLLIDFTGWWDYLHLFGLVGDEICFVLVNYWLSLSNVFFLKEWSFFKSRLTKSRRNLELAFFA